MTEKKECKAFPFIEGEKINLTAANLEHANLYTKWKNDPKNRKYSINPIPQSVEEMKKSLEPKKQEVKEDIFFEIWHKKDNIPIGFIDFIRIGWYNRSALIFLMIGELKYWGQGIASEGVKLLVNYGFNELNLHKISAEILAPDKASIRVFEKNSFNFEIRLEKEVFYDGKFVDKLSYVIFKKDWRGTSG